MKLRTSLSGTELAASAGVGLVNIAVQVYDSGAKSITAGKPPFQNVTDLSRVGLFGAGYYMKRKGSKAKMGEAIEVATVPLLLSSVFDAYRVYIKKQGALQGN